MTRAVFADPNAIDSDLKTGEYTKVSVSISRTVSASAQDFYRLDVDVFVPLQDSLGAGPLIVDVYVELPSCVDDVDPHLFRSYSSGAYGHEYVLPLLERWANCVSSQWTQMVQTIRCLRDGKRVSKKPVSMITPEQRRHDPYD